MLASASVMSVLYSTRHRPIVYKSLETGEQQSKLQHRVKQHVAAILG